MLTLGSIDPLRGKANALSIPPGDYDRKIKTQRNRRKPAQAVEHVVQFDSNRKISPRFDMLVLMPLSKVRGTVTSVMGAFTGAAWRSSARGVNRNLKWHNERNPCHMLYVSYETA